MKIFDCTTFFEEHLMMDLRFNILNEYVQKFIVVESRFSHSGKEKKLNFDLNNHKKFKDKIIYLVIDKEPEGIIKLKNDGMTQAKFFRHLITGYLQNDPRLIDFVRENGSLSIQRKNKIYKLEEKGRALVQELGLDDDQVEDIFDMIAEEFPDL